LSVEPLSSHEIFQVLVIGPNFDLVLSTFSEVSSFFQCLDDHQHFLIMDFIVAFHSTETLGQEGDWVPFIIFPGVLRYHSSGSEV
jgi:hypothetical protein